jgi:Rrf2 family protein
MTKDSRLSGVLHALLHLAEADGPVTSEQLARTMHTNPVVVRRLMAGLRAAGFVASEKGHGGGWVLGVSLSRLTLGDIHEALGSPALLAVGHRDEQPHCLVEQAVNHALDGAWREAEALLLKRLHATTLAALAADFHRRLAERGMTSKDLHHEHHNA